jgi:hypothetical protein
MQSIKQDPCHWMAHKVSMISGYWMDADTGEVAACQKRAIPRGNMTKNVEFGSKKLHSLQFSDTNVVYNTFLKNRDYSWNI